MILYITLIVLYCFGATICQQSSNISDSRLTSRLIRLTGKPDILESNFKGDISTMCFDGSIRNLFAAGDISGKCTVSIGFNLIA